MKKTLILWLGLALVAQADVRYTKKVTYSAEGMQDSGMSVRTVISLKGKRERRETITEFTGMKMQQTSLTLCDKEQQIRLDPDLKIYTAAPLRPEATASPPNMMEGPEKKEPEIKAGTGTITMTFQVKDLGTEKILGLDTRHYRIKMNVLSEGCCGDSNTNLDREVWMSQALPRLMCPIRDAQGDFSLGPCKIKTVRRGDVQLFDESNRGEAVKEIIYQDGKAVMTTELVEHSKAALDEGLFNVEGFRKVTDQEFDQQAQQKMMEMFKP